MAKRVNMKDIAKEAGVSVATVSYIINKKSGQTIAQPTIDKVNEIIKKLGYVPNLGARALASRHTRLIGLVIPQTEDEDRMMFANPFYGEFLSSLEYMARKRGYSILISGEDINKSYVDVARQRALDGIIIIGLKPSNDNDSLEKEGIPTVFIDSYSETKHMNTVNIDDYGGGGLATRYLLEMGHRRIAIATGYLKDAGVNMERFKGYKDEMECSGISVDESLICSGTISYEYGVRLGHELAGNKDRPTAVFATADILAAGIIRGLKDSGLKVPEDVSVVGFDDGFIAENSDPQLTTICQDVKKKAEFACAMVIGAAESIEGLENSNIVLPVTLVERDSVALIK